MLSYLRKTDPRIIAFAGVTIIAVLFAFYMAAKAITTEQDSPAYRKTPPKAFALPVAELIVDPENLKSPRLPDEAYVWIFDKANYLSVRIIKRKLTAKDLVRVGMSPKEAERAFSSVRSSYGVFSGRKTEIRGKPGLGSTTIRTASVLQTAVYGPSEQGDPGGTFTISYSFESGNGLNWKLQSIIIDV